MKLKTNLALSGGPGAGQTVEGQFGYTTNGGTVTLT
jgi:hypothetical protein